MPRTTHREIESLRQACVKVDQIGRLIGMTRIQSAELVLQNLAEVFQAMQSLIDRADRRLLTWRKKHNKLTVEDLNALAALEPQAADESGAAGEN